MGLAKKFESLDLSLDQKGGLNLLSPLQCDYTVFVEIPACTLDHLFCHRYQTDQLFVVRGKLVLVILQNRQYQYILLTQEDSVLIKIPPGVPHAAVNLDSNSCCVVNSLICHGTPDSRDYTPIKKPFPYDMHAIKRLLNKWE